MADEESPKKERRELRSEDIEFTSTPVDAETIFVDGIQGFISSSGVVKITFYEDRLDTKENTVKRKHVITLAMSNPRFKEISSHMGVISEGLDDDASSE
ncbi:hypothetical protein [Ferruginivarius sediminum]|uniref:hypothetical protein n=1 Tax=Ferruginivarius sediminum TaxID=2661937 RepID=UPI0011C03B12|nr:hypothetical protein [Ferruginivarius sediminum]